MQPDPGKGGAQGRVVQVGGPRQGEEAGPIKPSRPQRRCCSVERVLRGLGVDQCLCLQVPEPSREEVIEKSPCLRLPRLFARERPGPSEFTAGERGSGLWGRSGGRRASLLPALRCVPRGTSALSFANFDLVLGRDCSWRLRSRGFGN